MPKAATVTSQPLTLCAFRAAGLDAAGVAGGKLPERLVVAPWGRHEVGKRGVCVVNETTARVFGSAQKAMRLDGEVALDFEHNTVEGTPAYKSSAEPRPVAAYGKPIVEPGVGIVMTALRWTPEGKAALEGGHYKDLSPTVFRLKDGTVYALHSAGVCRHGEIEGLTLEAAAAPASVTPFFAALSALIEIEVKATQPPPMKEALVKLLAALGVTLEATADDAAFATAITDAAAKVEAMTKPAAMSAEITALNTRLEQMEKAETDRRRAALIASAVAEGKLIALSAEIRDTCPLNVLEDHIKSLPAGQVPMGRTTPAGELNGAKPEAFSAESLGRMRAMGVTLEDVQKHAPHLAPEAKK